MLVNVLLVALCAQPAVGWTLTIPRAIRATGRLSSGVVGSTVSDEFADWEAAMVKEHAADCEASTFARAQAFSNPAAGDKDVNRLGSSAGGDYKGGWEKRLVGRSVIGLDNAPYLTRVGEPRRDLIQISKEPILTNDECAAIIDSAEKHAAASGWGSRYTYQDSSHEVHVSNLPVARVILDTLLSTTLLPAAAQAFPIFKPESLVVYNALVVKYDASTGRVAMPPHGDFGLLTFNIPLNSRGEDYQGGGTWFQALQQGDPSGGSQGGSQGGSVLAPPRGCAVLHASPLVHAGAPLVSGERYQLVVFVMSSEVPDVSGRLQHLGGKLLNAGDAPAAVKVLEQSVRANGLDGETWYQLGLARQAAGDLEGAEKALAQGLRLGEAAGGGEDDAEGCGNVSFECAFTLGSVQKALNRTQDAEESFRRCIEVGAPPSPLKAKKELDATHNWGMTLLDQKRFEDAGLVFEQVIEADPNAAESWASLGVVMAELGQTEAALACQKQVLGINAMRESYSVE